MLCLCIYVLRGPPSASRVCACHTADCCFAVGLQLRGCSLCCRSTIPGLRSLVSPYTPSPSPPEARHDPAVPGTRGRSGVVGKRKSLRNSLPALCQSTIKTDAPRLKAERLLLPRHHLRSSVERPSERLQAADSPAESRHHAGETDGHFSCSFLVRLLYHRPASCTCTPLALHSYSSASRLRARQQVKMTPAALHEDPGVPVGDEPFDSTRSRVLMAVNLSLATVSFTLSLVSFYWFLRMRRLFRHE